MHPFRSAKKRREGTSLQAGMNFSLGGNHSVILMSVRPGAPYRDRLEDGGTTLTYEGHDEPKGARVPHPKAVDQPEFYPSGSPTQNGRFCRPAQDAKAGRRPPERVRVYEKIRSGTWSYNGISTWWIPGKNATDFGLCSNFGS